MATGRKAKDMIEYSEISEVVCCDVFGSDLIQRIRRVVALEKPRCKISIPVNAFGCTQ